MYRTSELAEGREGARRLFRWAKQGLLPQPQGHRAGLGRGQGLEEHLWDESCPARMKVIDSVTGHRVSRKKAEMALIARGFMPSVDVVRGHMTAFLDSFAEALGSGRTHDKPDLMGVAAVYRRLAAHQPDIRPLWALINAGLGLTPTQAKFPDGAAVLVPLTEIAGYFSLGSFDRVAASASDVSIADAYEIGRQLAPVLRAAIEVAAGRGASSVAPTGSPSLPIANVQVLPRSLVAMLAPVGTLKDIRRSKPHPFDDLEVGYLCHMGAMFFVLAYHRHKEQVDGLFPKVALTLVGALWPGSYKAIAPVIVKTPQLLHELTLAGLFQPQGAGMGAPNTLTNASDLPP